MLTCSDVENFGLKYYELKDELEGAFPDQLDIVICFILIEIHLL